MGTLGTVGLVGGAVYSLIISRVKRFLGVKAKLLLNAPDGDGDTPVIPVHVSGTVKLGMSNPLLSPESVSLSFGLSPLGVCGLAAPLGPLVLLTLSSLVGLAGSVWSLGSVLLPLDRRTADGLDGLSSRARGGSC